MVNVTVEAAEKFILISFAENKILTTAVVTLNKVVCFRLIFNALKNYTKKVNHCFTLFLQYYFYVDEKKG